MNERTVNLLEFSLTNLRCGLREEHVVEVLPAASVTPLPGTPAIVMGLLNVRGTLVPVLDIRSRLSLPRKEIETSDHFVLTRPRGKLVALHVDRAEALQTVAIAAIEDATRLTQEPGVIGGIARLQDGLLLIHDPERFLSEAEALATERAMAGPQG